LNNAFLYHASRQDNRHNFSVWWYHIYLSFGAPATSVLGAVVPTLAGGCVVLVLGVVLSGDVAVAMFAQTLAFVAFNKVCTAQVRPCLSCVSVVDCG